MACSETLQEVEHVAHYVAFDELGSRSAQTPVVEAFPTAALAVLVAPAALPLATRTKKSDRYFEYLVEQRGGVIGGVTLAPELRLIKNHDQRMAVVCALIAAWYILGQYTAVGNVVEGYFVMPPLTSWHPKWARELSISLAREPNATLFASSA